MTTMTGNNLLLTSVSRGNRKGRELQKLKKRLELFADLPANRTCADCPEGDPHWASFMPVKPALAAASDEQGQGQGQQGHAQHQLGVLCCLQCSTHHSQLKQATICQRKNINELEQWSEAEVEALEKGGGNSKVNKILEAKLCPSVYNKSIVKEDPVADAAAREEFIRHKYEELTYMDKELLEAHMQAIASLPKATPAKTNSGGSGSGSSGKNNIKRSRTYDSADLIKSRTLRTEEHIKKPTRTKALDQETDSAMGYGLPNHLGVKHKSSQNLLNRGEKKSSGSSKTAKQLAASMTRAVSNQDLEAGASSPPGRASKLTRRGRRRSSGETPDGKRQGSRSTNSMRSMTSTSTPSISRWDGGGSPPAAKSSSRTSLKNRDRWNTSPEKSSKNFTWNTTENKGPRRQRSGGNTATKPSSNSSNRFQVTDIAALRDVCIPPRCTANAHANADAALTMKIPQRAESDESAHGEEDDSMRNDDSSRSMRDDSLRMPRRVVSDDSGDDASLRAAKGNGENRRLSGLTFEPNNTMIANYKSSNAAAAAILVSRRSMPTLLTSSLANRLDADEDSIRNPYGCGGELLLQTSNVNSTFPVGRRRTCFDKPRARLQQQRKYGIKLRYNGSGFDTDTSESEHNKKDDKQRNPLPSSSAQEENRSYATGTKEGGATGSSPKSVIPTLGVFLQANHEAPNRMLGGRSVATASTGEDDIMGIGPRKAMRNNNKHNKGGIETNKPPRPTTQAAATQKLTTNKKGLLRDHLNTGTGKYSTTKMSTPLQALSELGSVSSGISFQSNNSTTEEDDLVRPTKTKTSSYMRRGRSCGGLRALKTSFDQRDDPAFSGGFGRSGRGQNAVW